MKKRSLIILALISAMTVSHAENAMYIYRNDGQFNAFLDRNIDSVVYSCEDTAGVIHPSPVTQLVYTPDSLYRIPLSAIDSVALTNRPTPELKSDVYHLTSEHLPYLTSVDRLTLTFAASTPQSLLPGKGNVVVTDVFDAPLQGGFAGRVVQVALTASGIVMECEEVAITDVYERLICVGSVQSESTSDSTQVRAYSSGSVPFELNPVSHSFGPVTLSDRPEARIDYNVFIEPGYHPSVTMLIYHTHNLNANYSYENEDDDEGEKEIAKVPAKLPYGLFASLDFGAYWEAAGKMSLEVDVPYTISFVNGFSWNESGFTNVNRKTQSKLGSPTANMELNGTITAGMFMRVHFGFLCEDVLSVNTTLKSGLQLEADYTLSDYDLTTIGQTGTVYTLLKDTRIKLNNHIAWDCGYNILGNGGEISVFGTPLSYEHTENINQWWLLPAFTQPTYREGAEKTTAIIETTPSRDLLMPVTLGIGLSDKSTGESLGVQNNGVSYRLQEEYPMNSVSGIFNNLEPGTEYEAYPVVKLLGYELNATPTKTIKIEDEITPGQEVDLGLSVNWAGWNVGASSPEQYGGYYAWGETEEKSDYSKETYKYWVDSDGDGDLERAELVNIGDDISGTQYDVARQKWGGSWRMPTKAEIDELTSKCKWTWYQYKGVKGYKVTGPNGNSIFLPAAGYRVGTSLLYDGSDGGYWSVTRYEEDYGDYEFAWHLHFYFYCGNHYFYGGNLRFFGLSVRPVK